MRTKETTKEKITTVSTNLHKTQHVILGEPRAIGKPNEKVSLPMSWRHYRLTRHAMPRLSRGSSSGISLYGAASNTGVCRRGWLVCTLASSNASSMNIGLTTKNIASAM
jgi:hypothetical protein